MFIMLKRLSKYIYFDWNSFSEGKRYVSLSVKPWNDYETGKELGIKLESVIAKDETDYGEADVSNIYEKLLIKVPKKIDIPLNTEIKIIGANAKVYGNYNNMLSIVAEDIQVVGKK